MRPYADPSRGGNLPAGGNLANPATHAPTRRRAGAHRQSDYRLHGWLGSCSIRPRRPQRAVRSPIARPGKISGASYDDYACVREVAPATHASRAAKHRHVLRADARPDHRAHARSRSPPGSRCAPARDARAECRIVCELSSTAASSPLPLRALLYRCELSPTAASSPLPLRALPYRCELSPTAASSPLPLRALPPGQPSFPTSRRVVPTS
jgi:hypothetical protein